LPWQKANPVMTAAKGFMVTKFPDMQQLHTSVTTSNCSNFGKQQKKLPRLATVASNIFAIPASQNKTERSFSAAGQ
jgi:hypothetical protein